MTELNWDEKYKEGKKVAPVRIALPEQFGFCIQYTDTVTNIRNYFPDFIAIDEAGNINIEFLYEL